MVFKPLRPPIFKLRKPLFSSPSSPRFSIPPSPWFSTPQSPDFQAPQAPCFQAPQLYGFQAPQTLTVPLAFVPFVAIIGYVPPFPDHVLIQRTVEDSFHMFSLTDAYPPQASEFQAPQAHGFQTPQAPQIPGFQASQASEFQDPQAHGFQTSQAPQDPGFQAPGPSVHAPQAPRCSTCCSIRLVPFVPVVGYVPPFPAAVQNHDTLYTETPSICHFQVRKEVLFHPGGSTPGVQAAQAPQAPSFQSTQALQAPGVQAPQAPNDQSLQVPGVPPVVPPAFFPFVPIVVYFPPFPDHVLIQRTAEDSFHQFSLADADHKFCSYLFYPYVSKEVLFHPVFKPLKPPVFKPLKPPIFKLLNPLVLPPVFNPHKAPVFKFFKSLKPPVFKSLKPPVFKDFNLLKPPVFKPLKPTVFHPPLFHLFLLLVMFLRFLDKSFTFIVKTSPALGLLLKAAAEKLPDLNCTTIESAMRIITGTAANMGIDIDPQVLEPKKKAVLL
ncbi:unnamed protein product [Brassica oleracea]